MPRVEKQFYQYIEENSNNKVTLQLYAKSPATAFLKYVVSAKNASEQCKKFKPSPHAVYSKEALDSYQIINSGLHASIMGNFETYQKYLFARMFEYSIYLNNFDVNTFIKKLQDDGKTSLPIDIERLSAYRSNSVAVGLVIADTLKNWQSPTVVNKYFAAFAHAMRVPPREFFTPDSRKNLSILWQMRHSIVHTASTITIPDAQKVNELKAYGGKVIALQPQFIHAVARKMHKLVKDATNNAKTIFVGNLRVDTPVVVRNDIDKLFEVKSSINVWLR